MVPPLPLQIVYGEFGKLSFRSKPLFHSLTAVDPKTLPISKMELFVTITNDFQSFTIVGKISADFLKLNNTTKYDYEHY